MGYLACGIRLEDFLRSYDFYIFNPKGCTVLLPERLIYTPLVFQAYKSSKGSTACGKREICQNYKSATSSSNSFSGELL